MSRTRYEAARELFLAALERPPRERAAFLDRACAAVDRAALRAEVECLLEHDADSTGFLGEPLLEVRLESDGSFELRRGGAGAAAGVQGGPRRSRYELLGVLARGGMGTVLRVRDRDLGRELAMKVASEEEPGRVRRLLTEARVTGQLDHPGIIPVHEVGRDVAGRLYFTMPLVEGSDLRRILGSGGADWTPARRVGVLLKVCEAVAYAHSRGTIHRDLKPANVMVGRFGEVYVMDWGLARRLGRREDPTGSALMEAELGESPATATGQVLGTPAYMSPEQARGERDALGPATDVYSAGALLYELLSGRTPFVEPGERVSSAEVHRRVLAGPPRPLAELAPAAPAELVAVCERAMARRISDRYPGMRALVHDLESWLEGRVVAAYATGPVAELAKWVQRNRALAAASAAAVLALVAGLTLSALLYAGARREAETARRELLTSERVLGFLSGMFATQEPDRARGEQVTVREVLAQEVSRLESELAGEPEVRARLLQAMGGLYRSLGLYPEAEPLLEEALGLLGNAAFGTSAGRLAASRELALLYRDVGRPGDALELCRAALEAESPTLGGEHPEVLRARAVLANLLARNARPREAEDLFRRVLAAQRRTLGRDHEHGRETLHNLAHLLLGRGRYAEAEGLLREVVAAQERSVGGDHPGTLVARSNLADVLMRRGAFEESRAAGEAVLEDARRVLGERHPTTLEVRRGLAQLHASAGRFDEAEPLYDGVLATLDELFGPDHVRTLAVLADRAELYRRQERLGEAELDAAVALEGLRAALGPEHPETLTSRLSLALLRLAQERHDEAGELLVGLVGDGDRLLGETHPLPYLVRAGLARLHDRAGRPEGAESRYREALAGLARLHGDRHPHVRTCLDELAFLLLRQGRREAAEPLLERLHAARATALGERDPRTLSTLVNLGGVRYELGRRAEAEQLLEEAWRGRREVLGPEHPRTLAVQLLVASIRYEHLDRSAEALPLLEEALELGGRALGPDHPTTLEALRHLARLHRAEGRPVEAELCELQREARMGPGSAPGGAATGGG